jgi:hypothetical protein
MPAFRNSRRSTKRSIHNDCDVEQAMTRRIRQHTTILLLVATLSWTVIALAATGGINHTETATANNSLTLTTSVLGQGFCFGDGEISTLQMNLRLRYTNNGRRPIILYKGSVVVPSLTVSRTMNEALAGNHELTLKFTMLTSSRRTIKKALDDQFLVLPAGSSFDTETSVAIPFTTSGGQTIPGTVRTGSHVLQVRVVTWPESPELARKLRYSWRRYGFLWADMIEAGPMQFSIESEPNRHRCPDSRLN